MICQTFRINEIGFTPYNLRHAYAVRGRVLGHSPEDMKDNMGHGLDMQSEVYQRHIKVDDRRIAYQRVLAKTNEAKTEQTEIELLKAENEALKAENESLRALLTEYQMNEAVSK